MYQSVPGQNGERHVFFVMFFVGALSGCAAVPNTSTDPGVSAVPAAKLHCTQPNQAIIDYEAVIDGASSELTALMTQFPKGGDIHNHLSGAFSSPT